MAKLKKQTITIAVPAFEFEMDITDIGMYSMDSLDDQAYRHVSEAATKAISKMGIDKLVDDEIATYDEARLAKMVKAEVKARMKAALGGKS